MTNQLNREEIDPILKSFNIADVNGAYLYLLSVYHNLNAIVAGVHIDTIKQVNISKIVTRDYDSGSKAKWLVSLYVEKEKTIETEKQWQWVLDSYRQLWLQFKNGKGGSPQLCISNMKKFFANNPEVRKEDVMKAASLYIFNTQREMDIKYLTQADYFISKKIEGTKTSKLEQYLQMLKDNEETKNNTLNRYKGKIN